MSRADSEGKRKERTLNVSESGSSNRVEQILEKTRHKLRDLKKGLDSLVEANPDLFGDEKVTQQLAKFRKAHDEANKRLEFPTLSIATLGTTSSGKSTLVNALVGRRVAPVESEEASAGILVLRHSDKRCLKVEHTKDASWPCGVWTDITDEDIYERVRNEVMRRYHTIRKQKVCAAPQVVIEGPLLPVNEKELLGIPEGVSVEFVDLPGLKSVQDRANLAIIQERVHKAFSLVVLDYMQVDDNHRKALLDELRRVVHHLQGRPDSMIFVLNRVDARSQDDRPLEDRLLSLQAEIKDVLELKHIPEVIPVSSLLLYNAQCAWGSGSISDSPIAPQQGQSRHLDALFLDCANSIKKHSRGDSTVKDWLSGVEARFEEDKTIGTEDMRRLLLTTRKWSGGSELWERLRHRVADSFPELVLLPALVEVFETYDELSSMMRTIFDVRKIGTLKDVESRKSELDSILLRLQKEVRETGDTFCYRLKTAVEDLKTRDQSLRARLTRELGPGFESLLNAINEVSGDLNASLVVLVRDAIKQRRGVFELQEDLNKTVDPSLAKDLAHAYDLFSKRLPDLTESKKGLVLKIQATDEGGLKIIESTERDAKRLFKAMREALSARAVFTLQTQASKIREALKGLLNQQESELRVMCQKLIPSLHLDSTTSTMASDKIRADEIELPETFFYLPQAVEQKIVSENEKVGTQRVEYTTGTCFKDTHYRHENVRNYPPSKAERTVL